MIYNSTFYPTPREISEKMLEGEDLTYKTVLEPHGGMGHLLEVIKEHDPNSLLTCEIDPNLRMILLEKGFHLIGSDFLELSGRNHIDYVIMNTPFENAIDHFNKAMEVVAHGGRVIGLINTETLKEKNSKQERFKKLLELNKAEITDLGQCFKDSERPTNVNVSMIKVTMDQFSLDEEIDIEFDYKNDEPEIDVEFDENSLIKLDYLENLVDQFNATLRVFEDYAKITEKLHSLISVFDEHEYSARELVKKYYASLDDKNKKSKEFRLDLQGLAWDSILYHPKFQKVLTVKARESIKKFADSQKDVQFTIDNIFSMFDALMAKKEDFLKVAILDTFDNMTKYHNDNIVHTEGWEHNRSWEIAPMVIIPNYVEYSRDYRLPYYRVESLNDIDRALCMVSGKDFDKINRIGTSLENYWRVWDKVTKETESEFFRIRFYKKGTLHLKWKDNELRKQFNYLAAKFKNWLPPDRTDEMKQNET